MEFWDVALFWWYSTVLSFGLIALFGVAWGIVVLIGSIIKNIRKG